MNKLKLLVDTKLHLNRNEIPTHEDNSHTKKAQPKKHRNAESWQNSLRKWKLRNRKLEGEREKEMDMEMKENQTHIMTRKMTFVKIFHQHLNLNNYDNEIKLLGQRERRLAVALFPAFFAGQVKEKFKERI